MTTPLLAPLPVLIDSLDQMTLFERKGIGTEKAPPEVLDVEQMVREYREAAAKGEIVFVSLAQSELPRHQGVLRAVPSYPGALLALTVP